MLAQWVFSFGGLNLFYVQNFHVHAMFGEHHRWHASPLQGAYNNMYTHYWTTGGNLYTRKSQCGESMETLHRTEMGFRQYYPLKY